MQRPALQRQTIFDDLAAAALAGVFYALLAFIGIGFSRAAGNVATIWPPTGVLLAFFLHGSWRRRSFLSASCGFASLILNLVHGDTPLVALGFTAVNLAEAAFGAFLVNRYCPEAPKLQSITAYFRFIVLAGLVATLLASLAGGALVHIAYGGDFLLVWRTWWIADGIGILIFGVAALTWLEQRRMTREVTGGALRFTLLLLCCFVASCIIFKFNAGYPLRFTLIPILLIMGVLGGPRAVAHGAIIFVLAGLYAALFTGSRLAGLPPDGPINDLQFLQLVLGLSSVVAMSMTLIVESNRRTTLRLRDAIEALPDAFALFDDQQRPIISNAAYDRQAAGRDEAAIKRYPIKTGTVGAGESDATGYTAWLGERLADPAAQAKIFIQENPDNTVQFVKEVATSEGGRVSLWTDITEMKRAELLLQGAISTLSDGFALYDAESRLVRCNANYIPVCFLGGEAACRGLTFAEILHKYVDSPAASAEMKHDSERWMNQRLAEYRDATGIASEQRRGPHQFLRVVIQPLDGGGRAVTVSDVTALKRMEQRLREAVDLIPDGFGLFDAEDRVLFFNEPFIDEGSRLVIGDDPTGHRFEEIVRAFAYHDMPAPGPDFDREAWIAARMERHRNPPPYPIEVKWGGERWMRITERRTAEGGYVGIWTDISDLKRAEEHLREAIESINGGFLQLDRELSIVSFNRRFPAMFPASTPVIKSGTSMAAFLDYGASHGEYADLATPAQTSAFLKHWEAEFRSAKPFTGEMKMADGRSLLISGLPTSDGGRVVTSTDITAQVAREAEAVAARHRLETQAKVLVDLSENLELARRAAEAASLEKSLFLASMSHELRTPLNAILGFAEMIQREMFGPIGNATYKEYIDTICESGSHLLSLMNDLLDISKIEAGKMELHIASVSAADLLQAVEAMVRTMVSTRGLRLTTWLDPHCSIIRADERALRQILMNLLSNAIKFTPAGGGRIHVAIQQEGDEQVSITVSDSGIGMSAAEIEKALQLYGQIDSNIAFQNKGTGLGLPLVKALVEMHGGTVNVESRKGAGTTITVLLPQGSPAG